MNKIIEAKNLSFFYPGDKDNKILFQNLNFNVEKGSFISILGPSGCGKSTLLSILSGFKKPQIGQTLFNNIIITEPFPQGQMVFQDNSQLLPWLTVERNIIIPKYRNKKLPDSEWDFYNELLENTALTSYKDYFPGQLSGGLKQRVSLARAIFTKSPILFMDEPFGSLDAPARNELQQLLLTLWKEREITIFFVTHDISEALLLSDKILVFSGDSSPIEFIDNKLIRPRNKHDKDFIKEKLRLYSLIDSE